jgi:hypothetical protein
MRRVEERRGSLGHAATLRFLSPLIEPDKRLSLHPALGQDLKPSLSGGYEPSATPEF